MALLELDKVMPFWKMYVGDTDVTSMMRRYIEGASFEYSIEGPALAQIQVTSNSFIEDIFREGVNVKFFMGWNRNHLAKMIDGKIQSPPDGSAQEKIAYILTIADNSMDLARQSYVKTFKKTPTKNAIIQRIAANNGYTADTSIKDTQPINPKEIPLQNNKTDLEFLYQSAMKWNCVCWIDSIGKVIYFYDADKAHTKGNELRERNFGNIEEMVSEYELGYRASKQKNNIANISWKFDKPQAGMDGLPGLSGAGENGLVDKDLDYDVFVDNTYYKLKPEIARQIQDSPMMGYKYTGLILMTEASKSKDLLRQYFVPVYHDSSVNKNMSHMPAYKRYKMTVDVELNEGDPFIRVPRTAWLYSGGQTDDSYLPNFLFKTSKEKQKYHINKVKTSLSNGMIGTKLELTI